MKHLPAIAPRSRRLGLAATQALCTVLLTVAAAAPGRAAVPPGEAVYQQQGCKACHAIDRKSIGPSFEAVARKFAGQPDAEQTLLQAVKNGHVGTWGQIPMPPHPNLPDYEIRTVVDWLLTLKPRASVPR